MVKKFTIAAISSAAEACSAPSSAAALRVECGSAGVGYRQAVPQAGEIQEHSRRRTSWGDYCEPSSVASKPVVKLDKRTEPARVNEAHVTEIDDDGGSALARRVR